MASSTSGVSLPHSLQAEREILASILVDPYSMDAILERGLLVDDFYNERHGFIFEAMRHLYEANGAIDEVTLIQQLKDAGTWEKIDGARTIMELLDRAGTTSNVSHYCGIVQDKAMVRSMVEAARTIEIEGLRGTEDVGAFLDQAERSVFGVLENRSNTNLRPISEIVRSAVEQISAAYDADGHVTGLGTGYRDLDRLTHGLQPGDLVIIAARPAMGKTSFVLNLAANAALQHQAKVAIFSLEMPSEQLATRLMASEARINLSSLRGGYLADEDWPKLTRAADDLVLANIQVDDTPGATPAQIRAKCRRIARKQGLDLIIIDYLQLMASGNRQQSREQEISYISRSLKGLAKDLSVPVIALSQLNRGPETRTDHRPMMSDLRESGAIEQDADLVAFIYREEVYNKELDESRRGVAELIIGKHRNGPIGVVKLKFWAAFTRFDNLARDA